MDLKSLRVICCHASSCVPDRFHSFSILVSAPPLWKQTFTDLQTCPSQSNRSSTTKPLQNFGTEAGLLPGVETPTLVLQLISFKFTFHFHPRLSLFLTPSYLLLFSCSSRVTVKLPRCPVGMWICECDSSSHPGPFLKSFFWKC